MDNSKKTTVSFNNLWQKYGTMGIFLLLLILLTIPKTTKYFKLSKYTTNT